MLCRSILYIAFTVLACCSLDEYLKSFVKDAIQNFNAVSLDVKKNEYTKALEDLVGNAKKLMNEQATLISAIMEDVNDAQSSTAVKQFKTDKVEALKKALQAVVA